MLMTNGEIKEALTFGGLKIIPYDQNRQQPCSYDARAGKEALVSQKDTLIDLSKANSVTLQAGDFALLMTYESFQLPLDMAANIGMKSGLARRGLILLAGMQIGPGFDGHLRLGLYNGSGRPITIDYLDPICTIEFHRLAKPAEKGIGTFPDLREGRIPEADKAYLRELETTSLSDLAKDMRTLTQNMNTLTTVTYKVILPALIAIFVGVLISLIFK
jgi:deoxycytidine triphosphate deaminase